MMTSKYGKKRKTTGLYRGLSLVWLTVLLLGGAPVAKAQQAQPDTLWGLTTGGGGFSNDGTLFSINTDGTNPQPGYIFSSGTDRAPTGSLTFYQGLMYGFTPYGGANRAGEIFSYNPATAVYTIVYTFDGTHGSNPNGKLTVDPANGLLYGVTQGGGANGQGVIFSFNTAAGTYTDLYDFFDDGATSFTGDGPAGPLTLYNNVFYGMANDGANYGGVIFSFDPATNTYTDLYDASDIYSYGASDPSFVVAGNLLYGVGYGGGPYEDGVLFSFDPVTLTYTELVDFDGRNGTLPLGIISSGGLIYGVTQGIYYGSDANGEIFSFSPASDQFTPLYLFSSSDPNTPGGNLLAYHNSLFGLANGGGANGAGGMYSFNTGTKAFTDLSDFSYTTAIGYNSNLTQLLLIHTVGTTSQAITFNDTSVIYGSAPYTPDAVASSGLPVFYSSDNPGVAVVNGSQIQIVGAGTANISVNQEGNGMYDSITVTRTLTVTPAPLLIVAGDTIRNQDKPNPVFRLTYTGLVNGDSAGSMTMAPVVTTTADSASPQGTYPITVSGAADPNYTITYQAGTLTVIGLLQIITFIDTVGVYGINTPVVPATVNSGLPLTYSSSNPAIAMVTANQQIVALTAGIALITATQAGNTAYAPISDSVSFVVSPAPLTITATNQTKVYNQPDPVFTATYMGFINGDDTNSLTVRTMFSTTAPPGSPPGTYLINAFGAADSNYNISYVSGSFLLTPPQGDQVNSVDPYFSSSTTLQVNVWLTTSEPALVQVYSLAGQRLVNQQASFGQGYNTLIFPTAGWASGIYIVKVTGDSLNLSKTIRKIN